MTRDRLVVCVLALTMGCTATRSVSTPDFARQPFEAFSREAAIAIARREWRLFGERYDDRRECPLTTATAGGEDTPERQEGLWQRVGEYRWLGLDPGHPRRGGTGKHDARGRVYAPEHDEAYAWSAAFISYVLRLAGAGDRIAYDDAHSTYINQAARAARGAEPTRGLSALRPELHAPQRGDLICAGRESAATLRFDDLPTGDFPSHCVIVVDVLPGAVLVIGGNVADAVTMTRIPTTAAGMLAAPDGSAVDRCASWCVVLAVRYDR